MSATLDNRTRRAKVRDEVVSLLKLGLPLVEGRVYPARTWRLQEYELPALLVYGWQEEKKRTSIATGGTSYDVNLILVVEMVTEDRSRDAAEAEALLDELTGDITEIVMSAPSLRALGGLVEHVDGVKTVLQVEGRESELTIARAHVAFDFKWTEVFVLPMQVCADPLVTLRLASPPA